MSTETNSGGRLTALRLLGVAFVILKLCSVIDWSWWWVTAPLWGPYALVATMFVAIMAFLFLGGVLAVAYGSMLGGFAWIRGKVRRRRTGGTDDMIDEANAIVAQSMRPDDNPSEF